MERPRTPRRIARADRPMASWRASRAPGDMLPVRARRWPRAFGVGRPLIREALRSLAELGLIETRPGARHVRARGGTLRASTAGRASPSVRRGASPRSQLSEARITLEMRGRQPRRDARHARRHREPGGCPRAARAERVIEHVKNDLAFHLGIAAAAHNPVIEMMLESIAAADGRAHVPQRRRPEVMRPQPALPPGRPRGDPSAATRTAAREAIRAHLTRRPASSTATDYERSVEELARQALPQLGHADLARRPRRPACPRAPRTRQDA